VGFESGQIILIMLQLQIVIKFFSTD
jgi:hypothetical protein